MNDLLKFKIGKDNQGVTLFITEEELEHIRKTGYSMRSQYTNQQWAKIRKLLKK